MKLLLAVAVGGALGALGRYLTIIQVGHWFGTHFPFGTVVVNVAGSFLLGALVEAMTLAWSPAPELRLLLIAGLLGAFTTFSTFSMDFVLLVERGQGARAAAYVLASVGLSIAGLFAGIAVLRILFVGAGAGP